MLKVLEGPKLQYSVVRQRGSHRILNSAAGYPPLTFAFSDNEMLGPVMVKRILTQGVGLSEDEAMEVL